MQLSINNIMCSMLVRSLKRILLFMRLLNTSTTWGQSCSTLIWLFLSVSELVCVHVSVFAVCACGAQTGLECRMHVFVFACLFFFFDESLPSAPLCLSIHFLRPSWVLWSLPARSWQMMRRAVLRGSHSTPLSNSTPTWLTWTGTCHRTTSTTSSAACRHKCRCRLCAFSLDL